MISVNNQATKRLCNFWAKTLTTNKSDEQKLTLHALDAVEKYKISDPIVIGIIVKRLSRIDTKRLWTYLKPNFDFPDTDKISESAAAMHCLSGDELDILLLCNLGYDIKSSGSIFGVILTQEAYLSAFHHLHSLIAFEDDTTGQQRQLITQSVISNMCNEIKTFVMTAQSPHRKNHLKSKPKIEPTTELKSKSELKHNVLKSIGIFAAIDIVAIASILCIFAFSNKLAMPVVENSPNVLLANTVDNSRQGLYYEPEYLPNGYSKIAHTISPLVARTMYSNDAGDEILFTQQVSEKKITNFSDITDYTLIKINGHKTAICIDGNHITLFWHSDFYAYSLTGVQSEEEMVKIAKGINYQLSELPFTYNKNLANENGDIIVGNVTANNIETINQFYDNYSRGIDDTIRVCEIKNDKVIIITVEYLNGNIYYTKDARRSDYGEHVFEDGMPFDKMIIEKTRGAKQSLMLYSGDQKLEILTF